MDIIEWYRLNCELDAGLTVHRKPISDPKRGIRRAEHVEKWSRLRELGHGGFGTVFLEKEAAGKLRAVKEVRKRFSKERGQDYLRELLAMAWFSKDQACFPHFQGWFEDDATIYIAMEYFELGDLSKCVTGPLPELEGKAITFQVAEALVMLHSKAITHRDVKPANIFVFRKGPQWWVKLGDFGISKRVQNQDTALYTGYVGDYVAPEINDSVDTGEDEVGTYTNAVDIWALGCLVHWLLAGQVPFKKKGSISTYCHTKGETLPIDLSQYNLSSEAMEFIKICLAVRPKSRPTAQEALDSAWLKDGAVAVPLGPTSTTHEIPLRPFEQSTKLAGSEQAGHSSVQNTFVDHTSATSDEVTVVAAKGLEKAERLVDTSTMEEPPTASERSQRRVPVSVTAEKQHKDIHVASPFDMSQWIAIMSRAREQRDADPMHGWNLHPEKLEQGVSASERVDQPDKPMQATVEDYTSDDAKEVTINSTAVRRAAKQNSRPPLSRHSSIEAHHGESDRENVSEKRPKASYTDPYKSSKQDGQDPKPTSAAPRKSRARSRHRSASNGAPRSSSLEVHDGESDETTDIKHKAKSKSDIEQLLAESLSEKRRRRAAQARQGDKSGRPPVSNQQTRMQETTLASEDKKFVQVREREVTKPQSSSHATGTAQPARPSPPVNQGYYSSQYPYGPSTSSPGYGYSSLAAQTQENMGYYGSQSTNSHGVQPTGYYGSAEADPYAPYGQSSTYPSSQPSGGYGYYGLSPHTNAVRHYGSPEPVQPADGRGYYASPTYTGSSQAQPPRSRAGALLTGELFGPVDALPSNDTSVAPEFVPASEFFRYTPPVYSEQTRAALKPKSKWKSMLGLG